MYKPVVGVIRGGPSAEYEVSLKTGATVLQHLPSERYTLRDILIDREGNWNIRGLPVDQGRALDQLDVAFNALHGAYGEDGTLQRVLDTHGVPYTGSAALASGIAMNKVLTKRHLLPLTKVDPTSDLQKRDGPSPLPRGESCRGHDARLVVDFCEERCKRPNEWTAPVRRMGGGGRHEILLAADVVLTEGVSPDEIASVLERLSPPLVVKPATGGSSVATSVVSTQEDLLYAVLLAFQHSSSVLVEQFVRGREATVAVVEDWRGEVLYAFPPVEIRPSKSTYFDYAEKYEGHAREVCPAPLPQDDTQALLSLARDVHQALNLRDYSRSDFIVARDGIYFLEVNTLPGLTPTSLLPKAVDATGATLSHFLDHLITRALYR